MLVCFRRLLIHISIKRGIVIRWGSPMKNATPRSSTNTSTNTNTKEKAN